MRHWTLWIKVLVIALVVYGCGLNGTNAQTPAEAGPATPPIGGAEAKAGAPAAASPDLGLASQTFVSLAERLSPAVVNIEVVQTASQDTEQMSEMWREFFGPFGQPDTPAPDLKRRGQGSGFIIDRDGYVVTNNHVVENAEKIKITLLDGREFDAEAVGTDPATDVALVRIKDPKDLKAIPLGDSDKLKVGEWVLAIGNPFGLSHTVTAGIVSAMGRNTGAYTANGPGPEYRDFIQTDASINPGNSGGPLINIRGEVVGINTMIHGVGTGIGFAIPISLARDVIAQLRDTGKVTRGWLGVLIQDVTPDIAESMDLGDRKGALVGGVHDDSPAAKGGMETGDVVIAVDGDPVTSSTELQFLIARKPVDKKVKVTVLRKGKEKTLTIELGERPSREDQLALRWGGSTAPEGKGGKANKEIDDRLGMQVQKLTSDLAERLKIEGADGVVVRSVEGGGRAEDAGLMRGDVILEVNQKPVASLEAFYAAVEPVKEDAPILLLVQRSGQTLFLTIRR